MLKKKIIFGGVVLLLAALFTLMGCSQATDSNGGSTFYSENHLFGKAEPEDVARAVASAKRTGRDLVLTDQLVITGVSLLPGVADFGDVNVRVEGQVWVGGDVDKHVIVNAARANLSFATNARIDLNSGSSFIYSGDGEGIYTYSTNAAYKVRFVEDPLENPVGTDRHIAVPNYKMGPVFTDVANHITALYVLDKLTIDGTSVNPASIPSSSLGTIVALGEVDLTENNAPVFVTLPITPKDPGFVFAAGSVLTSSAPGNITIGLGSNIDDPSLPTIKASRPIAIGLNNVTGNLTVYKVEGPETITINAATSISTIDIKEVALGGVAAINTGNITNTTTIKNNAGAVAISAAAIDGNIYIQGDNSGTINLSTPDFGANLEIDKDDIYKSKNTGTIAITSSGPIDNNSTPDARAIKVDINAGTLSLTATSISGGIVVEDNSGVININAPTVTVHPIRVLTNGKEINFTTRTFTAGVARFLQVPNNRGLISFGGAFNTSTFILGHATELTQSISGTGTMVFGETADFDAITIIATNTQFEDGFTTTGAATVTLNGNVTLAYEKAIDLTAGTGTLTLGAGKQILVGPNPVLAAGAAPVTISADGAVLTAGTELPADTEDEETFVGNKALILTGAAITNIAGELRVPGVLRIAFVNGIVLDDGAVVPNNGSLVLEPGGILSFADVPGANVGSTYAISLGGANDTKITGFDAVESRLQASGGPVTLGTNKISGSVPGATLTVVPEIGSPTISVENPGAGNGTLTIAGVNLDLSGEAGTLTIPGNAFAANKVVLEKGTNPGKLTLGDGAVPRTDLAAKFLDDGTNQATLSGLGTVLGDSDEGFPITIGSIFAAERVDLTITGLGIAGPGADIDIEAGATIEE